MISFYFEFLWNKIFICFLVAFCLPFANCQINRRLGFISLVALSFCQFVNMPWSQLLDSIYALVLGYLRSVLWIRLWLRFPFTFVWLYMQYIQDLSNGKRELICTVLKIKFNRIGQNWTAGQLDNLSQNWPLTFCWNHSRDMWDFRSCCPHCIDSKCE